MCNVNESWLMDVHIVCYQVLIIVVPACDILIHI